MEIIKNDYFVMEEDQDQIYITVNQKGFLLKDINGLLDQHPRIEINKFMDLRTALQEATGNRVKVGEKRQLVTCIVSKDKMKAKVKLNETDENFEKNKDELIAKIIQVLQENQVKEGLLFDVLKNELVPRKEITVAEGFPPVDGDNAIVNYYKLSERKPKIGEDGKADYYDMSFIDEVKKGDWLGEKIEATDGTPGRTVTGEFLNAKKGKDKRILFDKKTVEETKEDNKTNLYAKIDGVVKFKDGKIMVGSHLTIDGDVGVETGNIDFEGSVEISGTIQPGYSVVATSDIAVLSELGIHDAKIIESKKGDVFIKGGVFGNGKTTVKAKKNIFIKHANECHLEAGEDINIGYYSIGSVLKAKNILTDEQKGKLIGGEIEAKGKVVSAFLGNKMERKTSINVEGFDRNVIKAQLEELLLSYKEVVTKVESIKRQLEVFESFKDQLDGDQLSDYKAKVEEYEEQMTEVANIEDTRKALMKLLETKGEGQVLISQQAFPEVLLEIKSLKKRLNQSTKGTFYAVGKELHFE